MGIICRIGFILYNCNWIYICNCQIYPSTERRYKLFKEKLENNEKELNRQNDKIEKLADLLDEV
jgi:hypothetical protein